MTDDPQAAVAVVIWSIVGLAYGALAWDSSRESRARFVAWCKDVWK